MARLQADAPHEKWVPMTGSLGLRGRRHRRRAIRMLLDRPAAGGAGARVPGSSALSWVVSQIAPLAMRKANGRVLAWVWRDDPDLLVVMAQLQQATPQLRTARAMMPMEYDDTESFSNPHLGVGEKLQMPLPSDERAKPFSTYTWDIGSHFVTVTAVCSDRERFGTITAAVDDLARTVRLVDDMTVGEHDVLRIDPS